MRERPAPAIIVVYSLVLGALGFFGGIAFGSAVAAAQMSGRMLEALAILGAFFVLPVVALTLVSARRVTGFYLGLLPLLWLFGVLLREAMSLIDRPITPWTTGLEVYTKMATIGFAVALGVFLTKLAFSKTAAAYFKGEPPA